MKSRAERLKIQNTLLALEQEVKDELMQLTNVLSVAIGLKETAGQLTDEIVFQVFVKEKFDENNLDNKQIIPKTIKGYKTDVIIVPKSKKRIDTSEHRPLKGGIQITNGVDGYGTLGCFARLVSNDKLVLLSNYHVLYGDEDSDTIAGDEIGQPDIENKCCCCCASVEGIIGTILSPAFDDEYVDCAIASINSGIPTDFILNNNMTTTEISIEGTDVVVIGDIVRKIGRTSGFTSGIVNSIDGLTEEKDEQIFIRPTGSETYREETNNKIAFSDKGDSGAVIINEDNNIIGLLWGGDSDNFSVDETYACHIDDVLEAFRDAGSEIEIISTPSTRTATRSRELLKPKRLDLDIRDRLLETEKGKILVNLFEEHQKEVLQLINHNRSVKVMWHRQQGPAYTVHFVNSFKQEDYQIPTEVRSISLQELLIKMAAVLKKIGSDSLKKAIEHHALEIIQESYGINKVEEYLEKMRIVKV